MKSRDFLRSLISVALLLAPVACGQRSTDEVKPGSVGGDPTVDSSVPAPTKSPVTTDADGALASAVPFDNETEPPRESVTLGTSSTDGPGVASLNTHVLNPLPELDGYRFLRHQTINAAPVQIDVNLYGSINDSNVTYSVGLLSGDDIALAVAHPADFGYVRSERLSGPAGDVYVGGDKTMNRIDLSLVLDDRTVLMVSGVGVDLGTLEKLLEVAREEKNS